MDKEKVVALFADEAFVKELATKESAEDAQALFAANDVTVSVDELNALRVSLKQQVGEELTEDELALVAGGAGIALSGGVFGDLNLPGIIPVVGSPIGIGVVTGIDNLINRSLVTRW